MQCERLIKLTKSWYLSVKDETMAPARMVAFMKQHIAECEICLSDPDVKEEIEKITEIVLPESKIPKAVRIAQEKENGTYDNGVDDDEEMDEHSEGEESDLDDDDLDTDLDDL